MPISNNTKPIRQGEEVGLESLNRFLKPQGFPIITKITQFQAGYSNLTYLLHSNNQEYVLRKPPLGAKDIKGGHDILREFRLLQSLTQANFESIPKPLLACENEGVIGAVFYIMDKVDGLIYRANDAKVLVEQKNKAFFNKLSKSLCLAQVKLHAIDIKKSGLIELGKPEGYVDRQILGWSKRYLASKTESIPWMDQISQWLIHNKPISQSAALIHNDFKYDNVVFTDKSTPEIAAILDWEMSTVGDPLMDLGTSLAYWAEAGDNTFEKSFNLSWLPGNMSRKEYAYLYAETSGRDISKLLFYYVFGLYKNAVIIQQIYKRYTMGLSKDPRFAKLILGVHALSGKAIQSIERDEMM